MGCCRGANTSRTQKQHAALSRLLQVACMAVHDERGLQISL